MRTLVISDLHLGSPGRFPGADLELTTLLAGNWDRVVVAGDLFDLWVGSLEDAVSKHGELLSAFRSMSERVVYVIGNHDAVLKGVQTMDGIEVVSGAYRFLDGGKQVAIAHGDAYDFVLPSGILSRVFAWVGAWIDRMASWSLGPSVSVQRTLRRSFAALGDARSEYAEPVAKAAVSDLDADVVVIGHTHLPEERCFGGCRYANTGSWGPADRPTWVEIADGEPVLQSGWPSEVQ